jgi:SecD/SecF fusion protein
VVIFDRIREYRGLYPDRDQHSVFNDAISSTLSRTFSTSMSVLVVLVVIFFFGGEVIRGFIFAMLIGVIVGTYSSVFVASPTAFMVLGKEAKKESKKESNQPAIAK